MKDKDKHVIHTLKLPSLSGEQPCTIIGMTGELKLELVNS